MRVLGRLSVLGGVVIGVLGAVSSHTVGRLDQVVAQIAVAALAERGIFGLELAGFVGYRLDGSPASIRALGQRLAMVAFRPVNLPCSD